MSWWTLIRGLNLPNKLTLGRMLAVPLFLACLLAPGPWAAYGALVVFIAAALTDYWDGALARRRGLITNFGRIMDPLADKLLMATAFIAFVQMGYAPAWMVVLIIAREFAITGLRVLAAAEGRVIAASTLGKHKTISQIVAVLVILTLHALRASLEAWVGPWLEVVGRLPGAGTWLAPVLAWLPFLSMLAAAVFSLYSGVEYLVKNRHLLKDPVA